MAEDRFRSFTESLLSPSEFCYAVVPHDGGDLPHATKALYVGGAGNVALVSVRGDSPTTFVNVPAGTILDVRTKAVLATGTTATDIVGLA